MAWADIVNKAIGTASGLANTVLGYQTQKANLEAARAQARAAQAAAAPAPAPTVSPYAGGDPTPKTGGFMSNPLYIGLAALLVLAVGFFALRSKG